MQAEDIKSLEKIKGISPDSIRVIINLDKEITGNIKKLKFLIKRNMNIPYIIQVIRKKINISKEDAVFLFIDNCLAPSNSTIGEIYETHGNKEYISLIMTMRLENTFGR